MFDLEKSVKAWRDSLPDELRSRSELLDELEQHLRDDFERRTAAAGSPAEAWVAALNHLGSGEHLAAEFAILVSGSPPGSQPRGCCWLPELSRFSPPASAGHC